jgi:hypothetical protein
MVDMDVVIFGFWILTDAIQPDAGDSSLAVFTP